MPWLSLSNNPRSPKQHPFLFFQQYWKRTVWAFPRKLQSFRTLSTWVLLKKGPCSMVDAHFSESIAKSSGKMASLVLAQPNITQRLKRARAKQQARNHSNRIARENVRRKLRERSRAANCTRANRKVSCMSFWLEPKLNSTF